MKFFNRGDFFGIGFNFDDYDNWGFGDFFVTIVNDILNTAVSMQNVSLDAGFLGTISSANFIISNNELRGIISSISNSVICLTIAFFYFRFIKKLSTLDLSILEDYDIDNMINIF